MSPDAQCCTTNLRSSFDSLLARARVGPNEVIDVDFLLTPLAQTLRPVAVTADGSPNPIRLTEFEERRAEGFGRFLDHVAFERSSASQVDAVLVKLVPGIRTKRLYGKIALESQRDGRACYPQVVVNGISMYNGVPKDAGKIAEESATFDLNSLRADQIIGFEWHTPSTTPLRYNATGAGFNGSPCGTAIFWTK